MISVVIPACNEEGFVGECLLHILASEVPLSENSDGAPMQVILAANGCTDNTVDIARGFAAKFQARGVQFDILNLPVGSKVRALNTATDTALYDSIVYVDADVHVSPGLVAGIAQVLDRPEPAYASGRPRIRPAKSFVSDRYARFWQTLPFVTNGVPGFGVYAANKAGRARFEPFPDIIADDAYIRFHFASSEMHLVPHDYSWPITEQFSNLVRVRRRQNEGLAEIHTLLPDLVARSEPTKPGLRETVELMLRDPIGFSVYSAVAVTVKSPLLRNRSTWERGR
ncbi:MAG: glycosyltransferase [Pseudomonadota bacterium]